MKSSPCNSDYDTFPDAARRTVQVFFLLLLFLFFFIQFARSVFLCVCFSVLIGKTMDRNPDFCLCTSGNHGGKYIFEALSYVLEDGRQQVFAFIQKRSMFRQVAGNQVRGKANYQSDVI